MTPLKHGGFLVPNAGGEGVLPRMAEVDQIDFNTLSQVRWGVVDGCQVSVGGTTATSTGGIAIVDGQMVKVNPSSTASLGRGLEQDRFDLVAVGVDGALKVISGTPSFDPVFPDPPKDATVLAAVFCPTGSASFSTYVIDKRVMATTSLLSTVGENDLLIRNADANLVNLFTLRGNGQLVWNGDTTLVREDVATLRLQDNLNLRGRLQANGDVTAQNLTARNLVAGKNIFSASAPVGDEPKGALRQDPSGRLYLNAPGGWVEIATVDNAAPVGTILQTVETSMPKGWVQFGTTVNEQDHPSLFGLTKLLQFVTGTAPNRSMALPDLTDRVLMGTRGNPTLGGENNRVLTSANLPAHVHGVRIGKAGGFTPTGTVVQGGDHNHEQDGDSGGHGHNLIDPGHKHDGMEYVGQNSYVVALVWGGKNKIDAEFNDRNHTFSVEALQWTAPAKTGIRIGSDGSGHTHVLKGVPGHVHGLSLNPVPEHDHPVTEFPVGSGSAFSVQQAYLSVYMYIKA